MLRFAAVLLAVLAGGNAVAALDLRSASVERLDNGLTVILLEDRNLPVVSVQMLYRVGARDESYGRTGIAHFLEHMAFRSSANFPDTGLVSSIYAVGGEWHGYTWTDQTTYFATVPKEHTDLLLRIEADRMRRLTIAKEDMEAERGAVLAEMHMYENYPSSMLLDALMFTSFLAHPYRNNTIGFESDIEALAHADVVAFYERHYRPANGVLAVVGDFDREEIRVRIEELFGEFTSREPTPLPHTREPVQQGERRIRLEVRTEAKRFMIGYRAPSANHPDFAAFLVLQEVLGNGSGVNFRQNDWGTPVGEGSLLYGAAADLTTWYPPSAQDYIFVIGGSAAPDAGAAAVEAEIEERVASAREGVDDDTVRRAVADVLDELVFDVVTTEDAAHQLAFFDGLHALDTLLELPERVSRVTREDLRRVARHWLLPERRTIAWHVPGAPEPAAAVAPEPAGKGSVQTKPAGQVDRTPMPEPVTGELAGGIPVIVQPSDLSSSACLQVLLPAASLAGVAATPNDPVPGYSSLSWRFRPHALADTLRKARAAVDEAERPAGPGNEPSPDPETRLEQTFTSIMEEGAERRSRSSLAPALIVVSGDVDADEALALVEGAFGDLRAPRYRIAPGRAFEREDVEIGLGVPVPQARLGYIAPAPGARDERSWAWRILLYVLSHDYEGRLGKEAISRRGLAYYIDSRYRSDGVNGWITLAVGVDPDKLADLKALMLAELRRLGDEPPSESEIAEAKAHLVGRARSAAQSNAELADALARSWVLHGKILTVQELRAVLARITRTDVQSAVDAFAGGNAVTVAE